ncbi:MAG: hypothetical protein WCL14_13305 [Bacteroidota bacterium]
MEIDLVGTHVQIADSEDAHTYIIPLCKTHDESSETLSIIDSCTLVSADILTTCGLETAKYLGEKEL